MSGIDILTLGAAKNYSNIVGSTIQGTSYDYDTSKLTFETVDGNSWSVQVNNGMNQAYKNTLDNTIYDNTDGVLKVNGVEVLTKDDAVSDDDNLNFDGWFD